MKVLFRAAAPLAAGFALLFTGSAMASDGAVYTQTNSPTGNAVHRLDRGPDGSLTPVATYRTGGAGTGATLQSQGMVALSDDGRVLVAVDAGSNDIAAFRVGRRGHLTLVDRQPSGGTTPNSVDIADGSVYVLNRGRRPERHRLRPRRLGQAAPAQHRQPRRRRAGRRAGLGRSRRPRPRRHRACVEPDRDVPAALRPHRRAGRDRFERRRAVRLRVLAAR